VIRFWFDGFGAVGVPPPEEALPGVSCRVGPSLVKERVVAVAKSIGSANDWPVTNRELAPIHIKCNIIILATSNQYSKNSVSAPIIGTMWDIRLGIQLKTSPPTGGDVCKTDQIEN
jgi:hypothetical protein